MNILITGGAGFIGSYLVDLFYNKGHKIYVIDKLHEQIHGKEGHKSYLYNSIKEKVEFFKENILDSKSLSFILKKVDCVVHLAAETGTGQSMYDITNCVETNSTGTSNLLEQIIKNKNNVEKIILASSRAVYGEGKYYCAEHGTVYPGSRPISDLKMGRFECRCPICNKDLKPIATDENSLIQPQSVYGITKFNQEQLIEVVCKNIELPYSIFRFQNVYGKGQSLNNPYTGILSIFTNLLLNQKKINVFEDGLESRDFVHVKDVAAAVYLDMISDQKNQTYNVGSGFRTTVLEIVHLLEKKLLETQKHEISGAFRLGDIRHNFAELTRIENLLGFRAKITLEEGVSELIDWIIDSRKISINDEYEKSLKEMRDHHLYYDESKI